MARSYDAAVAALTLDVPFKWIDNLLSRHRISGVDQATQGTTRRLSPAAIVRIRVIRILSHELGLPVPRAVELAEVLEEADGGTLGFSDSAGGLRIDFEAAERWIALRLPDAVESARPGDTIELNFDGRPPELELTQPIRVNEKDITIRAGQNSDGYGHPIRPSPVRAG